MSVAEPGNTLSWFAVRVKSNCEKSASLALRSRGLEEFLPVYRQRRRGADRFKEIEVPLFSGYVFSRFDLNRRLPVLTIPGVVHIVGFGRTPVPVDEQELAHVRTLVTSRLPVEPWPFFKTGQRVLIERGPLCGVEGVVIEVKKNYRLVASVTLLQRSVSVEIDREWALCISTTPRTVSAPQGAATPARGFRLPLAASA
jgi:transcription antitermination factor NusG